ncbi:MAG: cation diffusion facilitator family transporter [Ignavibacteriales bacterium]|nr:cation diffusion facilitator family transporter [Ignavibacteriales bacterium]
MIDTLAVREKKNIALTSVFAAVVLTGMKLAVGLMTNSLGILSEAAHSGLDLLAAIITYVAVSVSDKPPDEDHQYGHGKMENVSAFFETILLLVTCGWIIWEAVERLTSNTVHVEANIWSFGVIVVSIVIDFSRSRALSQVAKKHHSQALEADALHFSSDIWSSLAVLAGLVCVSLGYSRIDSVAALAVAILVLFVSYRLGRRTIDALMDRVPEGLAQKVGESIKTAEGVEELRSMRVRGSGSRLFVDAIVGIRRTMPFDRAHRIMDDIEKAIHAVHPEADVTVHAEPMHGRDESMIDKVRMIVIEKGVGAPHNLEVHQSDGKYFIDFDVEYSKEKTFVEAHALAEEIEEQIRREIPSVQKVTIHLEEFLPDEGELTHATEEEKDLCLAIETLVLGDGRIRECTDITVLKHAPHLHVTLTCRLDSSKTLAEVHQIISQVESHLYQNFPQVRRFTIHAEPV